MNATTIPGQAIALAARQIHAIADASAVRLECRQGCVWITLDHDSRDIVLEPGESFTAPAPARALVYAFEPSRLALEPVSAVVPAAGYRPGQRPRTTAQVAV